MASTSLQTAAEKAVSIIGCGYDLASDIRLSYCKQGFRLIEIDENLAPDLVLPGGIVVPNVSKSIKCDKGERMRFRSDVLSFHQMSEQLNKELSLTGKIPAGLFNAMFAFSGCWQKDAATTKSLAYDGWYINLYNIELARSKIELREEVKQEVPCVWDPAVLAGFIEKYGTHIIVGVKMGGKDIVHIKQLKSSSLQATDVQKLLKKLADERFCEDANGSFIMDSDEFIQRLKYNEKQLIAWKHNSAFANSIRPVVTYHKKEDLVTIHVRRGGIDNGQAHSQWLSTISQAPDVISMSFVPIVSLLEGVRGSGFLTHAVNLYLRYKPPIEELHQFLEFQLPRQWAPVYGDLPLGPLRRNHGLPSLQFKFMGPKLYVNTNLVDSGSRPVTGIRLYLEGKKSDHLAIHLLHLSSIPNFLHLSDDHNCGMEDNSVDERDYYEPVHWSLFSHVCTAPVQHCGTCFDDSASIVTKAWLEVKDTGMKKVLFLRLGFSMVASAKIRRSEWDGPTYISRKSGSISTFVSTRFSTNQVPRNKPAEVFLNSAVFPGGPPGANRAPKMCKYLDTNERVRGPEEPPGHWVVTGAKLMVEGGKISFKVKYSLLTIMPADDC
ncbi:MACPF domain-containing protein NSL1-like isoform X1 [Aristolochia californica]|uniref:MACPF domain-containing protein NSL1-like isoform X1 n=2 Tax=Aristolochia californica TaxID=171875 RepID=UPI0035DFE22B